MGNDLISRSALLESMAKIVFENVPVEHQLYVQAACKTFEALANIVPAVDAELVRRGRWQFEARGKDGVTELPVCSGCGATPKYYVPKNDVGMQVPPYCHECGAKMDAEVKYETPYINEH